MNDSVYLRLIKFTISICGVFSIVAIIFYAFLGRNDHEALAHFGDFLGGVSGTILAFANLIVLITISYQLRRREEEQAAADREAQDKRAKFELAYGLKHEAIKELSQILNKIPTPFHQRGYSTLVTEAARDFSLKYESNSHLFPGSNEAYNAMKNSFIRLHTAAVAYDGSFGRPSSDELVPRRLESLKESYSTDFAFVRPAFIDSLRSLMHY